MTESMRADNPREAMLAELISEMEKTHRGRRVRRRVSAVVTVAALIGAVILIPQATDSNSASLVGADALEQGRIVQIIKTDPTTCDRFAAVKTGRAQLIDDQRLQEILSDIGYSQLPEGS